MSIAKKIVGLAVIGRDAKLLDGLSMLLRGITFVGEPVVLGVFLSQLVHIVITIGLCQDAGSSDGEIFPIAFDDGGMGKY